MRIKRRSFLAAIFKSSVVLFGAVNSIYSQALSKVDNKGERTLDQHQQATLERLFFLLYPFPSADKRVYLNVIKALQESVKRRPEKYQLVIQGLARLDTLSGKSWFTLSEEDQLGVLKKIEKEPFFVSMLAFANSHLLNDPEVWRVMGYEGSSLEKGGYKDRGFNDIDWL
ncbi:MAG: gluconate 2-dehydrogenase subunit 3 family protein [Gammaproteobacteria bacterium]|nr:gluconate 2-dehydrogenase subunit 3 family protein [Gammaproteobacteria bacterium]